MSNMAIKYNMMKKAKNFAMGGACDAHGDQACPMCHGGKMAEGGEVEDDLFEGDEDALDMVGRIMKKRAKMFADGGMASESTEEEPSPAPTPMYSGTVANTGSSSKTFRNKQTKPVATSEEADYAEGGDVVSSIMKRRGNTPGAMANETTRDTEFKDDQFDDMVLDDHLDHEADDTVANSGDDIGDEGEDERRHDIVSEIMRSRAKKDRLPRIR